MHSFIIFGASGDLTSRKLIPALYKLKRDKHLPDPCCIVGFSRSELSDDDFRTQLKETTKKYIKDFDEKVWSEFCKLIYYVPGDINKNEDFQTLLKRLQEVEKSAPSTRVYYLSTSPTLYSTAIDQLGAVHRWAEANLGEQKLRGNLERRLVIEKPFGTDSASAKALNEKLHDVFSEKQVYRIDHYLGKETVQNIMVLRFANTIFEPLWNRNYIDHVQITVAEEVPVGRRGGYYDTSGVLRDMFQNHLLQLMMVVAMEAPSHFNADLVRDEKVKVLRAVRPFNEANFKNDTFRAQYDGYRKEEGVPADSETATFAAIKLEVDSWRWNGVPFYLRSGKAMSCRTTQIVIQFRDPPLSLFNKKSISNWDANQLVIQIQPAEGIELKFQTKVPEAGMRTRMTDLDFSFQQEFKGELPDAYQRLLLDALNGDASLFARSDEVEYAWSIIDPIIDAWKNGQGPPLIEYPIGLWGPDECTEWMRSQNRNWFDVCPVLQH
jgi:glucose-6-phosphate 1-dehydrogenase